MIIGSMTSRLFISPPLQLSAHGERCGPRALILIMHTRNPGHMIQMGYCRQDMYGFRAGLVKTSGVQACRKNNGSKKGRLIAHMGQAAQTAALKD